MSNIKYPISKKHFNSGFTLLELVVVFAVIGIVTSLGIASLVSYGNKKTLETASLEVMDMLNLARSRSLSQVKPAQCGVQTLTAYQVDITVVAGEYSLSVVCGNTYELESRKLPNNVNFELGSSTRITFPLLNGSQTSSEIIINGYGETEVIDVNSIGSVSIRE